MNIVAAYVLGFLSPFLLVALLCILTPAENTKRAEELRRIQAREQRRKALLSGGITGNKIRSHE